jgi:hypothetical protein
MNLYFRASFFMNDIRKYVVTGGPGFGKTSIINELERRGYNSVHEISRSIIKEQLDSLKKLDLYNKADNIYMSIISDDNELDKLKDLLKNEYNKIEIYNVYKENYYEYPGIQALYDISKEDTDDTILLYFHSKGMTSDQHETRQCLFKYTIANYEQYINEFSKNKNLDVK